MSLGYSIPSDLASAPSIGSDPEVPVVDDGQSRDLGQFGQVAVCEKQNVVEHAGRDLQFAGAVAVVPCHIGQVQQIECRVEMACGERRLDAWSPLVASLLTSDRQIGLLPVLR